MNGSTPFFSLASGFWSCAFLALAISAAALPAEEEPPAAMFRDVSSFRQVPAESLPMHVKRQS